MTTSRSVAQLGDGFALPRFLLVLLAVTAASLALGVPAPARAAPITWTGLGATTSWNLAANWSTLTVPGAGDVAIFDGTSSKAAVTTANVSVGGVVVTAAYAGSITQGAGRTITVGASGWVQDGAAFVGSAASVTVNGPFTLTGGAYTSTTGTLSVSGAFTIGAGTFSHNGGTLRFTGPAAPVDVAGSLTVWNLVLAHNNATSKTLDPADLLVADGTLTLTNGRWDGGELRARGPISATSGFDGGNATLRIDGSADQLFTGTATTTAGELPNLVIDKPSGTLTLAGTIRVLSGGWSYVAGTLDPGSSTVVFDSGSLLAGSHSLANVVLRGSGAKSIAAGETLTVSGTLNLVDGTWDGGTLAAHGPLTQAATFDGGSGTLRIDGSADQLFTGSATAAAGALPALVIDKPSGTLTLAGTIRTARDWTFLGGALDAGTSTLILTGVETLTTGGTPLHHLIVQAGLATLDGALVATGALTVSGGTFDLDGHAVDLAGELAVSGTILADGVDLRVAGNVTVTGTFDAGTGRLVLDGSALQALDMGTSATYDLRVDNSAGVVLAGDLVVDGELQLAAGTLSVGSHRLTITFPIVELGGILSADATSAITVAGTAPSIRLPASIADLGELEIVNPLGVALDGPLTLHIELDLDGGPVDAGPHLVTIAPTGVVSRTSGHVIGLLLKTIGAGASVSVLFEIGDAAGYAPVAVILDAVSVGGTITASTAPGDDVAGLTAVGLVPSASVNRTWSLTSSGVVATSALVDLVYLGSDLDPDADPSALLAVLSSGGGSTLTPVANRTASSLTTAIAGPPTGTFALGMPGADLAVSIAGPTALVVGMRGDFHVSATNGGPFDAPSVVVEVVLPPAAALAAAAASQGSCVPTSSGLTCDLGSLASGESATIDLLVSFDAAGTHILEASVSLPSGAVDPDATGDTAAMSVAVSAPEEPPPAPSPSPSPGSSPRPVGTDELPDTSGPPGEQAISAAMAWLALAGLVLAAIAGRRAALSRR